MNEAVQGFVRLLASSLLVSDTELDSIKAEDIHVDAYDRSRQKISDALNALREKDAQDAAEAQLKKERDLDLAKLSQERQTMARDFYNSLRVVLDTLNNDLAGLDRSLTLEESSRPVHGLASSITVFLHKGSTYTGNCMTFELQNDDYIRVKVPLERADEIRTFQAIAADVPLTDALVALIEASAR